MKNALFFHRVDWDGLLSAAIVLTAKEGEKFDLFPVNYGNKIPSIEELKVYDTVYVVDFSLPREYNEQLPNILWLDHHISAIKANEGLNVRGIRDVSHSACEICWIWFMKSFLTSAPDNLLVLGEYDIFEKSGRFFRWDWILAFQMGARTIPLTIESAKQFLDGTIKFNDILHAGNSILAFKREEEKIAFSRMAWDVTIDGHPAKALLTNDMSSLICEQTLANGDANIILLLNRNNDAMFKLSIRVAEKYEFNASEFAKKFGGGGHVKAAGCTIPIETFIELYTKHSI